MPKQLPNNVTAIGITTENDLFCWSTEVELSKCKDAHEAKIECIQELTKAGQNTVPERVLIVVNGTPAPEVIDDFNVDEDGEPE
jgi:hypothetical protein